jgi:hypothetical protein
MLKNHQHQVCATLDAAAVGWQCAAGLISGLSVLLVVFWCPVGGGRAILRMQQPRLCWIAAY